MRGDWDGAREHIARLRIATPSTPGVARAMCSLSHFIVAACTGTLESAIGHNRAALEAFREAGMFFGAINAQIGLAALLAPTAPTEELIALISRAKEEMRDTYMQHHETQLLLVEAFIAIRDGHHDHAAVFQDAGMNLPD